MRFSRLTALFAFISLVSAVFTASADASPKAARKDKKTMPAIYSIPLKTIDGRTTTLAEWRGKAILLVNTASACGYTPQYKGLEELFDKYKGKGFVVLGFPSNDFGGQEPGAEKEIKSFCELNYGVSFPLFAKVKVKGEDKHPLYRFLQEENPNAESRQEVKWNFSKFLVDREGKVTKAFPSKVEPMSGEMTQAVEAALGL